VVPSSFTEAWRVVSWPPILWQAKIAAQLQLVHFGTRVLSHGEPDRQCCGHTVWGTTAPGGPAGMAWDWVQIPEGVVALADPLALITNLWLLDIHGQVLTPTQAAPHLNGIVHALPWQAEVQRALEVEGVAH
jgi:hypothetical protein